MKRYFLLVFLVCISMPVVAADFIVNGKVLEKGTRTPLQGAIVSVKDQAVTAAITDAKGHFQIILPAAGEYTLVAANSGIKEMQTVQIPEDEPLPELTFYLRMPQTLGELVVTAERSPDRVSKASISGQTIRKIAGSGGDPLNALQILPGVVSVEGSSTPAVRGSGPGDNLYYVDGLYVNRLFHFGSLSVFNADLIQDFNLYSAAFAPHYGNVTGAVIDVALREPRKDRLGAKVNVNVMGADFLVEGPSTDDQSFYFAARRSYVDLFIKEIKNDGNVIQIPKYWDYQGKYLWQLNDTNRLTMHLFGVSDEMDFEIVSTSDTGKMNPVLVGASSYSDMSSTQAVVLDSLLSGSVSNKLTFEHADNRSSTVLGTAGTLDLKRNNLVLREQLLFEFDPGHELLLANELMNSRVKVAADFQSPTCTQFNPNCDLSTAPRRQLNDDFSASAWSVSAQDRKRVLQHLTLIGGVRYSGESYTHKTFTEPRIGVEWEWSEQTLLSAGWGKHNQNPPDEQWVRVFGNPDLGHIRAVHSVLGVKHKVNAEWNWKTEAYYKKLSNLVINDPALNYINAASGKAYGLELLIKKEETADKLSGWFVLNLAKSQRQNDVTGESFRFKYDQPVNAKLVGTYKFSDLWSLGAKWEYHSGTPYTPIIGTSGTYADGRPIPVYAGVNTGTMPVYHRLDLRLDRNYVFNKWKLNTYFELNNVYQRKNVVGYSYDPTYTQRDAVYAFVLPVSFGVQAEF